MPQFLSIKLRRRSVVCLP